MTPKDHVSLITKNIWIWQNKHRSANNPHQHCCPPRNPVSEEKWLHIFLAKPQFWTTMTIHTHYHVVDNSLNQHNQHTAGSIRMYYISFNSINIISSYTTTLNATTAEKDYFLNSTCYSLPWSGILYITQKILT